MNRPPFEPRDPYEVEGRRLALELDTQELSAQCNRARKRLEAMDSQNPDWPSQCEEVKQLDARWSENQDTLGLYHWFLGRNIVADKPKNVEFSTELLRGIMAGPVACIKALYPANSRDKQIDFTEYERFTLAASGWLYGHGTYVEPQKKAKGFRDKLLKVPFQRFDLLDKSRSYLVLKVLA